MCASVGMFGRGMLLGVCRLSRYFAEEGDGKMYSNILSQASSPQNPNTLRTRQQPIIPKELPLCLRCCAQATSCSCAATVLVCVCVCVRVCVLVICDWDHK